MADEFNFTSSGGCGNYDFLYGLIGLREGYPRAWSCVLIPTRQFKVCPLLAVKLTPTNLLLTISQQSCEFIKIMIATHVFEALLRPVYLSY